LKSFDDKEASEILLLSLERENELSKERTGTGISKQKRKKDLAASNILTIAPKLFNVLKTKFIFDNILRERERGLQ